MKVVQRTMYCVDLTSEEVALVCRALSQFISSGIGGADAVALLGELSPPAPAAVPQSTVPTPPVVVTTDAAADLRAIAEREAEALARRYPDATGRIAEVEK